MQSYMKWAISYQECTAWIISTIQNPDLYRILLWVEGEKQVTEVHELEPNLHAEAVDNIQSLG